MALEKITNITGKGVYVPGDDIDTDRIIPARFMKCVTFDGLGEYLFYDVRKDQEGNATNHNLNNPKYDGASILLSGNNFGCGSSREHAPQAIYRAGYRAVIAQGFAEIFFGNCSGLGIPCVVASENDIKEIVSIIEKNPNQELSIDLESMKIKMADHEFSCTTKEGARHGLISGKWDPIAELLEAGEAVDNVAQNLSYMAKA